MERRISSCHDGWKMWKGKMRHLCNSLAALAVMAVCTLPAQAEEAEVIVSEDLQTLAAERTVGFYAVDLESGKSYRFGEEDLDARHAPWSTFKIPNYLIALETGVADGPGATRSWDKEKHPPLSFWPKVWKKDHTLDSALKFSVVWYFKDVAEDVGTEGYRDYLARFSYGNQAVPEASNDFWLGGGGLAISPREQVSFLTALLAGGAGVSKETFAALEAAAELGRQDDFSLHAKTGAGRIASGPREGTLEGWFVGWVDGPGARDTVFALYATAKNYGAIKDFRQEFSEKALQAIGALPAGWGGS